jgi:hypothetical protein
LDAGGLEFQFFHAVDELLRLAGEEDEASVEDEDFEDLLGEVRELLDAVHLVRDLPAPAGQVLHGAVAGAVHLLEFAFRLLDLSAELSLAASALLSWAEEGAVAALSAGAGAGHAGSSLEAAQFAVGAAAVADDVP